MTPSPVSNTCDQCYHWDNDGMSPYGVCRKNPPTGSGWPRVSRKDWCGEWSPAEVGLVPEAQAGPVSNPLPPGESVEATTEKRRPGRPRKVET